MVLGDVLFDISEEVPSYVHLGFDFSEICKALVFNFDPLVDQKLLEEGLPQV